jgi:hypothetical protein
MKRVFRTGVILGLALSVAVPVALAGNVTVGRFYLEIAKAKNLASADAATAETDLRHAGFDLPKLALDKSLTEGDMKSISTSLGLMVKTDRPAAAVTESQLGAFISSFGPQIVAPKSADGGAQVYDLPSQSGRGKGKKKGHHKSSIEPF